MSCIYSITGRVNLSSFVPSSRWLIWQGAKDSWTRRTKKDLKKPNSSTSPYLHSGMLLLLCAPKMLKLKSRCLFKFNRLPLEASQRRNNHFIQVVVVLDTHSLGGNHSGLIIKFNKGHKSKSIFLTETASWRTSSKTAWAVTASPI